MRVLILGGDGMLGHQLLQHLAPGHEVKVTLRRDISAYSEFGLFNQRNSVGGVELGYADGRLLDVVADFHPNVIVNCVGIVKQRSSAKELFPSLEVNALLPHRLARLCKAIGARLVHLSTDCVFSGRRGRYREEDPSDADDVYGRTKFLGEVSEGHCLTLRTSIIGRELSNKTGLLEWFLGQRGTVKGFVGAIYSGFTTLEMSRIIEMLIVKHPTASGLYHVASDPISKFDLLCLVKAVFEVPVNVVPETEFSCDRSLDGSRFRREFDYRPPSWAEMVRDLRIRHLGSEVNGP